MSRRLVVMRHAKAEQGGRTDFERVLTGRGHADAAEAGAWLATQGFAPDHALVSAAARAEQWGIVTENVADYAAEPDVVLVFVLKRHLPPGGGQAAVLARILHRWLIENPEPYVGAHWPQPRGR